MPWRNLVHLRKEDFNSDVEMKTYDYLCTIILKQFNSASNDTYGLRIDIDCRKIYFPRSFIKYVQWIDS